MSAPKIPLHHRKEYYEVSEQARKLSGWWPMLTMFAAICLVFFILAPFSTPPMPPWVRGLTAAGTLVLGGLAAYIFFKKRSLIRRLRELG